MKQVTLYQCSFCTRTFFYENECFLHECSEHHEIAARQALELKKYCEAMCKEGHCQECQFYPNGEGRCFISGKPCEWQIEDKSGKLFEWQKGNKKEENPQDDNEL